MAYLHKNDIVMIRTQTGMIQARVVDMQFRRFRRSWKDKKTGEQRMRWKAVPYAICEVFIGAPTGTEFLIPGYKLRNEVKDGETLLVLRDQYAAEFNGTWVNKMIEESRTKRASA
jgi:polyferredoxin